MQCLVPAGGPIDLKSHGFRTLVGIPANGGFERRVTVLEVVKVRNRDGEARALEAGQSGREATERAGCLVGLVLGFDPIEASGSLLKMKAPPMATFWIDPMGAAFGRRYETQMATLWIVRALPFEFLALAAANSRQVVHERRGVSKHPGVDPLEDVASRSR